MVAFCLNSALLVQVFLSGYKGMAVLFLSSLLAWVRDLIGVHFS